MDDSANSTRNDEDLCVKVAVKLRPLIESELSERCQPCLFVTPGVPQVSIGRDRSRHSFTYDNVFGEGGADPDDLFPSCVAGLVDGLFKGYNATVFAYGQTGSGKTFTMGSAFNPGGTSTGVIPNVMETIFNKIGAGKGLDFTVRVSFVEIHKEEIKDLLVMQHRGSRPAVAIREVAGGVCLAGALEKEVTTKEEMMAVLEQGSLCRATASTSMNNRSSRSHAIYTISLEQRRQVCETPRAAAGDNSDDDDDAADDAAEDFLCAKMHLVDLAGSERAKRTKAEGARLQEGIHINRGLLALGNVITALVDRQSHIPYRDSKLTRLLQDSLGGNSRTLMIACVSPADANFEETLNTLRYADRARHIHNKPVVNRDPVTAQLTALRQQVALLRAENMELKRRQKLLMNGDNMPLPGADTFSPMDLSNAASMTESRLVSALTELEESQAHVAELQRKNDALSQLQAASAALREELAGAEKERDTYRALNQQLLAHAGPDGQAVLTEALLQASSEQVLSDYSARNSELQQQNHELQAAIGKLQQDLKGLVRTATGFSPDTPPAGTMASMLSAMMLTPEGGELEDGEISMEVAEQQRIVDDMFMQMERLQSLIDHKDSLVQQLQQATTTAPHLKARYDQVVTELQHDLETAEKDRSKLTQELHKLKSSQDDAKKSMVAQYKERIEAKEGVIKELKKKEAEFRHLQNWQRRQEHKCATLSEEIQRYKNQKVQLQKAAEAAQKQMAALKQAQSREVLQLKKQTRKDAAKLMQYEAMHAKQQAVLKRKTQEAEAARKRLKDLTELQQRNPRYIEREAARSASSAGEDVELQPNSCAPLLRNEKSRRDWLEHELDYCNQVCELQTVLEGELAIRSEAARQLREVEKKILLSNDIQAPSPATSDSLVRSSIIRESRSQLYHKKQEMEAQIDDRSERIKELEARITRAKMEEETKSAIDARRWTGVRTIVEARVLLRTLFKCASEYKVTMRELQNDNAGLQEQYEIVKLERDAARAGEHSAKRQAQAAQLETGALRASTASTPLPRAPHLTPTDDAEVHALLREGQAIAMTPLPELRRLGTRAEQLQAQEAADSTSQDSPTSFASTSSPGDVDSVAEENSSDEDDGRDRDWRPEVSTPFLVRKGKPPRQQHKSQQPRSRSARAPEAAEEPDAAPPAPGTTSSAPAAPSSKLERAASGAGSSTSGAHHHQADEPLVLRYINEERYSRGLLGYERLTVKVLKEELTGKEVGGELWKPKNKNKEQMVKDYLSMAAAAASLPSESSAAEPSQVLAHRSSTTTRQRAPPALQSAPPTTPRGRQNRPTDSGEEPPTTSYTPPPTATHRRTVAPTSNFKTALLSTPLQPPMSGSRLRTPPPSASIGPPGARPASARWQVRTDTAPSAYKTLDSVRMTPQACQARKEAENAQRRMEQWQLRRSQHIMGSLAAGIRPGNVEAALRRPATAQPPVPQQAPPQQQSHQPWKM